MFTEAEQDEIEALTESLIKDKEKELRLLKAIAGDAKYAAPKKIRNEIISYAELAETTFLKGKQLTLLLETGKKESAYDFSKMGTTEEFPCSLEYDGEVWEFYLPPTPSVKNGTTARNVGRYIGYLYQGRLRCDRTSHPGPRGCGPGPCGAGTAATSRRGGRAPAPPG